QQQSRRHRLDLVLGHGPAGQLRVPATLVEQEIQTMPSRLLLISVPQWQISVDSEWRIDASWHPEPNSGNVLFLDGSVRFVEYATGLGKTFEYVPGPVEGMRPFIGSPPIPPMPR
ncbi:MAG: H-X9-DG-CTERM domain-containing protein, partial [Planctomycetota bacterium]